MTRNILHIILFFAIIIASCTNQPEKQDSKSAKASKESLIKANKTLVKTEDQRIEDFISRYKWEMNETKTGLRYMVYENGHGPLARKDNIVRLNYSVKLLTGELCYSSKKLGPKEFRVGKGGVENGLEEAILFLKKGDRAKIIIPSHLAFGLVGDGNKIPAKATLVYDIELIELK